MIDAATVKPTAFDVILVHSFSRFFRDQFQLEFYVRRLAKNGVRLVSITQELGDDPMSNMIRQIMALFDEYQSKENAKHTLRAMKENARQGFWKRDIDTLNADLSDLTSFVLPGGTPAAAHLHLARTICRRAERVMVELAAQPHEPVSDTAIQYINRLSDFLFVASRVMNQNGAGDVLWVPGQNR
jgi:ATP:cob(I)alamin adenosyltransferase